MGGLGVGKGVDTLSWAVWMVGRPRTLEACAG
jgi:hypothetical protein